MIYQHFLERVHQFSSTQSVDNILIGVSWILAEIDDEMGLCFGVGQLPRTIPWSGTLTSESTAKLGQWLLNEHILERSVALAVINACINARSNTYHAAKLLYGKWPNHLRVFEHFTEQIANKNVVVVGHYPYLREYWTQVKYQCLELNPKEGDLTVEHTVEVLKQADWVFITASSIANHTIADLLDLSRHATVVLMGPSLTWLDADVWQSLGVNYLAGVKIHASKQLRHTVAEAGGTRIFENGVSYALLAL